MSAFDDSLARARQYLARFRGKTLDHQIGGKSVTGSGGTFETRSPVDDTLLATVARGTAADIDQAAQSATRAFLQWRKTSGEKRTADPLHEQGRTSWCGKLPLLR